MSVRQVLEVFVETGQAVPDELEERAVQGSWKESNANWDSVEWQAGKACIVGGGPGFLLSGLFFAPASEIKRLEDHHPPVSLVEGLCPKSRKLSSGVGPEVALQTPKPRKIQRHEKVTQK